MRFLFDTNVIIDANCSRGENARYAQLLILKVARGELEGYLSSKQITDIYYILRKYISDDIKRREIIKDYLSIFKIIPLLGSDLAYSLSLPINDYEDAVIEETAKANMVDTIITSNSKDYQNARLFVVTPKELCNSLYNDLIN